MPSLFKLIYLANDQHICLEDAYLCVCVFAALLQW